MVFMIQPVQVSKFWDVIKYTIDKVDKLSTDKRRKSFNKFLCGILSGKTQCFIRINKDRKIISICLTELRANEILNEKELFITHYYSFKSTSQFSMIDDLQVLKDFALRNNCVRISTLTSIDTVFSILTSIGFTEVSRNFSLEVL